MNSEEALKSRQGPSRLQAGWLAIIADAIVFLGYFASLSLLILSPASGSHEPVVMVHLVMNALLLLVGVRVLRERGEQRRVCAIDLLMVLFVISAALNVVVAEVKHAALMRLPLYVDYAIAYWIGSVVFSRRAGAFYALMVGYGLLIGVVFLVTPRSGVVPPVSLRLLGIVGTFSLVGFLIAICARPSAAWSRLVTWLLLAGVIGIGLVDYARTSGGVWQHGTQLAQKQAYYSSSVARGMFHASPILGYGIGNFELVGQRYSPVPSSGGLHLRNSHFLELIEMGVVGLIVKWLVVISLLVWAYLRRVPRQWWEDAVYYRLSFSVICVMLVDAFWFPTLADGACGLLFWGVGGVLVGKCLGLRQIMPSDEAGTARTLREGDRAVLARESGEEREVSSRDREMFTRSMLPRFGRRPVRRLSSVRKWANICLLVCAVVVLSIVESLPVVANRLARLNRGEALWSENYGKRLALAAYLMPYDPTYQMKLAIHYHALIEHTGEAAVYMPWIAHAYERAAELNPYEEEPAVQLARFFHVTGDYLSTIHSLEGSLVYLPMSPELHAWLIRAYIEAGHYERALEGLQQLSVLIPANASVHAKMEALYERLGEYRAALRQAYYVLQKNPADVEMWDKIRYLKLRVAY